MWKPNEPIYTASSCTKCCFFIWRNPFSKKFGCLYITVIVLFGFVKHWKAISQYSSDHSIIIAQLYFSKWILSTEIMNNFNWDKYCSHIDGREFDDCNCLIQTELTDNNENTQWSHINSVRTGTWTRYQPNGQPWRYQHRNGNTTDWQENFSMCFFNKVVENGFKIVRVAHLWLLMSAPL